MPAGIAQCQKKQHQQILGRSSFPGLGRMVWAPISVLRTTRPGWSAVTVPMQRSAFCVRALTKGLQDQVLFLRGSYDDKTSLTGKVEGFKSQAMPQTPLTPGSDGDTFGLGPKIPHRSGRRSQREQYQRRRGLRHG